LSFFPNLPNPLSLSLRSWPSVGCLVRGRIFPGGGYPASLDVFLFFLHRVSYTEELSCAGDDGLAGGVHVSEGAGGFCFDESAWPLLRRSGWAKLAVCCSVHPAVFCEVSGVRVVFFSAQVTIASQRVGLRHGVGSPAFAL